MRKVLNDGTVCRQGGRDKAVPVVSISFPGLSAGDAPSAGDDAVLNLKVSPQDPYELGDALAYQDGNGRNAIAFEVQSAVAPSTYNVQVVRSPARP